jgi:hypothetical protein
MFRQSGGDYFNPDEVTARILAANPALAAAKANSAAWHAGKRRALVAAAVTISK